MKNGKRESLTGSINAKDKMHIEKTALHIAIENGHTEIVQLLLSNPKININIKLKVYRNDCIIEEKTALFIAIENENIEIIKMLLSKSDIDINCMSVINTSVYISNIDEETKEGEVFTIKKIGNRKEIYILKNLMKLFIYVLKRQLYIWLLKKRILILFKFYYNVICLISI